MGASASAQTTGSAAVKLWALLAQIELLIKINKLVMIDVSLLWLMKIFQLKIVCSLQSGMGYPFANGIHAVKL